MSEATAKIESVYCACGAQWHGKYAVNNEVITAHMGRWKTGKLGCFRMFHYGFKRQFKCACAECRGERKRK